MATRGRALQWRRRSRLNPTGTLTLRCGRVDLERGVVERGEASVRLSRVENRLLSYLAAHEDQRVTREQLLVDVWGYRPGVVSRTVFSTVERLRKKIERDPSSPEHLVTEPLGGYRFVGCPSTPPGLHGREALVAELAGRTQPVALTGTPGVGKTTLARHLAPQLGWSELFVDLEPARDSAAALAALRRALNAPPDADLRNALSRRAPLVLVLDGMRAACAELAALVTGLDGVRAVATTTTDPVGWATLAVPSLAPADAEALLLSRLEALGQPLRARPPDQPRWEALLCEAVGHHPLAIVQLAHALQLLEPGDVLSRPERLLHASLPLQDALDLGWRALSDADRTALARLAVCPAPFPVDAAEHLLVDDPAAIARLVRVAWLERVPSLGTARLQLLPPIRAYVHERMRAPDDALYGWCVERLARGLARLDGADGREEAARLHADMPLIVHTLEHHGPSASIELLEQLAPVLCRLGLDPRLADWLRQAGTSPRLAVCLGRVQIAAGEDARDTLREAVELASACGDAAQTCEAHIELTVAHRLARDADAALAQIGRAQALLDASGSPRLRARVACERAMALRAAGDHTSARAAAAEAIALARHASNLRLEAAARGLLGTIARQEGRLDEAIVMLAATVTESERVGDAQNAAIARCNHANVLLDLRRYAEARAELDAALAFFEPRGYRYSEGFARLTLAHIALGEGDTAQAVRDAIEARLAFLTAAQSVGVAHASLVVGRVAHAAGDLGGARAAYRDALTRHPTWLPPKLLLALADGDEAGLEAMLDAHRDIPLAAAVRDARSTVDGLAGWIGALATRAPDDAGLF